MDARKRKLILSVALLLSAVVDIISDWYVFTSFVRFSRSDNDHQLTITLGIICGLSTILFGAEIYNFRRTFRILRKASGSSSPTPEEETLQNWAEVITFFQTVVEDFPIILVMYFTLTQASCGLYLRVFQRSFAGNIALLSSFMSCFAKMMTSLFYCCQGYIGLKCARKGFCFLCRITRALSAMVLMSFTAYMLVILLREGTAFRTECSF